MKVSPDRALFGGTLLWLALGIASVPLVVLRPFLPLTGALWIAVVLADLLLAVREDSIVLERVVPQKGARDRSEEILLRVRNPLARAIEAHVRDAVPSDLMRVEPSWPRVRIEAGGERTLRYAIRPQVRGRRRWGRAAALVRSPLGLLRRVAVSEPGDAVLVQPETGRYVRAEALDPKRVLASLGVRPRRQRGDGLEFDSLREYVIGDEPRRIDWRATARRGRPIVRTHRHEESRTVLLVLDHSRLMGARAPHPADPLVEAGFAATKLDHAIDAALALAFASLVAGDRVGLVLFDREVDRPIAPIPHRASLARFVEALSEVQASGFEADYRRMTREVLAHQRKRAMVIVLTDFMEVDREELIAPMSLLARRHEVVFVALREPILEQLEEDEPVSVDLDDDAPASLGLYRRIVLADLLREREGRLVALRRRGLSVLDVPPSQATAGTLNRFMTLRYGGVV